MPSTLEDAPFSTSEKLILMKGSKIYDGHPFWPWDKDPSPIEFEGEEFRDNFDYKLSGLQSDILLSWERSNIKPETWRESLHGQLDLVQDVTNDCSIVASLCVATARAAKVGSDSANVFSKVLHPFGAPSPNGKYVVKLQFNGCWRKVVIDDHLPVSRNDQLMHVTARGNLDVIWPALIEKSLLKVMGGYDFPGSDSGTDLWALAGWIPERIPLSDNNIGPLDLWRRISKTFQYGDVMITLGTPKLSMLEENVYGLASGHDYAVIDLKEDADTRKLLIKNPWSRASDHLRAARRTSTIGLDVIPEDEDEDENWESTPVSSSSSSSEIPGTRWMDLHDVFRRFETIYLSWNPDIFAHRRDVHFTYKLTERAAASGTFTHSPQFSLESKSQCTVWLLLCKHVNPKLARDEPNEPGYIGLSAYQANTRIVLADRPMKKTPYVNSENVLLRVDVEADVPYVVVVSEQDMPSDSANFTLTAFSTKPLAYFRKTPDKYEHATVFEGSWSINSAGGNANSPLHHYNPQYTLTVSAPGDIGLLLCTPKKEYPVNIKVVWANGKRIQPGLATRDVYGTSGEYRKGSALVEIRNVQTGVYTVVASVFEVGYRAPFSLTLFSTVSGCTMKPAPADDAGMFRHTFMPVVFRQGADRVLCPLKVAQTCKVRVKAQSSTSSSTGGRGVRSPLRVALEYGQGPDMQQLAGSGDPRSDRATLVLTDTLIQTKWCIPPEPGVWLVVERVGGAFVPQDEKVYIEVLCSASGLQAGQWGQETDLPIEEIEKSLQNQAL